MLSYPLSKVIWKEVKDSKNGEETASNNGCRLYVYRDNTKDLWYCTINYERQYGPFSDSDRAKTAAIVDSVL